MISKYRVNVGVVLIATLLAVGAGAASARTTIVLAPQAKETITGDVLWMRTAPGGDLLAPFALDFRGRWCWAPAEVFEESCTVLVGRRKHGRRTLENGSRIRVRVTYDRQF
jgi:hypothetical protein